MNPDWQRTAARCHIESRMSDSTVRISRPKKGDHVFLVDGSGYIFRAYHALPPLTAQVGRPAGRRGARLLQHAVEAAARHEAGGRSRPISRSSSTSPRRRSATRSIPTTRRTGPTAGRPDPAVPADARGGARLRPAVPRAGRLRGRRPHRDLCAPGRRGRRRGHHRLVRQGPDAARRPTCVDRCYDTDDRHERRSAATR